MTPPSRREALILATCCLTLFMNALDGTIANVALPTIQRRLHAPVSGLEWIVDAYLLVMASLLMLSGSTGDRIGRRRMFRAGLAVFAAGSLSCSLAPDLPMLVGFRMVQGIGAAMLIPNALSIVTATFTDPRRRAVAIGIWSGVFGASTACGPVVGGILVDLVGWRSVFWVNVPVAAVAALGAYRVVPESRATRPRPVDVLGQVLMLALLGMLTASIIEGPLDGWTSPLILGLFSGAAAALAAFVHWERRTAFPLLDLRFFRSPSLAGAVTMAVCAFFALSGFLFLNTLYLQEARRASALAAGVMTLPAMACIAAAAPFSGRIVALAGPRAPLLGAGICMTAGATVLATTTVATPYAVLAAGYVLLGLGLGLANPPITNAAVSGLPVSQAGTASAVSSGARQLGNVLGVALMGSLTASAYLSAVGPRLRLAGVPAATRHAVLRIGLPTGGGFGGQAAGRVAPLVRQTFAVAAHIGWDLAIACGLAVLVVGAVTTGARASAASARVGALLDAAAVPDRDEAGSATGSRRRSLAPARPECG